MNSLKYKGYTAKIDFDPDDEIFVGRVIGINDVIGFHAESARELKQAFKEAVDHYLESCKELKVTPQKSFSGKFVIRLSPEIHEKIVLAAAETHKSLNRWIEDILKKHVKAA
ncbi:MAG: type II toxin-antitoxin system HicB family antitoxin [Candidatus Rifleibacteriota bacterium]|jgi:predicted HicB family RNase H-like nuclease